MRISDWSSDVCSSDLGFCADAALSRYVILPYPDKPAINGKSLLIASGFQAFWAGSGCSILKPPSDPPMLLEPVDVRVGIAEPFLQHVSAMFAEPWRTAADFVRRAPPFSSEERRGGRRCDRNF